MPSPSPLLRASNAYLRQLDKGADPAVASLLANYERIQHDLNIALDSLQAQMVEQESPTNAQLYRLDRFTLLLAQVRSEMEHLGQRIADHLPAVSRDAVRTAVDASEELVRLQSNDLNVTAAFGRMDPRTVERALSFVQPHSPLMTMLKGQYGQGWADVIASQYISGVALGWSPRRVVSTLRQTVDVAAPADLDRIVRTAQLYAYRATNSHVWQQSGVVESWVWSADLSGANTCEACWAQNGSVHPVTEILQDHFRGRCAAVPQVSPSADFQADPLTIPTGEEVFSNYSEAKQREVADAGGWGAKYRAWKDGAIDFSDMATKSADPIYGEMNTSQSLKALLGQDAVQYYA
jgi:hypothetical protein